MSKRAINWKTLPGTDDITRVELPNGITIPTRPNFHSPSVIISGYLPSGGMFDPDDKLGLAYFTAPSLRRGSSARGFQEIYDTLESIGATLGFGASVHSTTFGGRCLAEDFTQLLGVYADCLCNPVFPGEYIERLRYQLLTALAIRDQSTSEVASMKYEGTIFAGHPYGRPEDGRTETVQNISRDDILAFHQRYFGPQGMVVVVVGSIPPDVVVEQVHSVLGGWGNPGQVQPDALPAVNPIEQTTREHIPVPGKVQTDLVLGTLGPKRKSDDYLPASLGNNVLGQFGLMGRIGDAVREKAGLAYYASTSLSAWTETGSWEVSAGVNPKNLDRAIEIIRSELRRFIEEPVTAEELDDSQSNFIGRLPLSLESNVGVAGALLRLERFELGLDYYRHYPQMVREVTPARIQVVAQRYLDLEKLCIISAGPKDDGAGPLSP